MFSDVGIGVGRRFSVSGLAVSVVTWCFGSSYRQYWYRLGHIG